MSTHDPHYPGAYGKSPHSSESRDEEASTRHGKKRRLPLSETSFLQSSFPRKRSFTACRLCRQRKTKCDNVRPTCSSCRDLKAACAYEDQRDHTTNDPASQIMQKLDYLIDLVEHHDTYSIPSQMPHEGSGHKYDPIYEVGHARLASNTASTAHLGRTVHDQVTINNSQLRFRSCEDILEWAVFEGRYDRRSIEALIFDPTLPCEPQRETITSPKVHDDSYRESFEDPRHSLSIGRGIREEDVFNLLEVFLSNVHTKNPILDADYLRDMGRMVVKEGFGWTAPSCLILIACALATISAPFVIHPIHLDTGYSGGSLADTPEYATAEAYYNASRKRIGLLTNNLIGTECYFLFGVYGEMYSLRPLRSSISFNRACVAFQILTWMRSEYYIAQIGVAKARASRLYWSCLKSEHEISVELRFPSSGLTRLNYTTAFPPPPLSTLTEQLFQEDHRSKLDFVAHSPGSQDEVERSWYYYLADIAARRILERVVDTFYVKEAVLLFHTTLQELIETAQELQRQLTQWYQTLPWQMSFVKGVPASDELAFHLQARGIEIKERIYRPFMLMIIHKPLSSSGSASILPYVQEHIEACFGLIKHWNVRHRHHGTWLMVRQSFASTLLLIAAYKAGIAEATFELCVEAAQLCLSTLRYWEQEAPDLKASRLILEQIVQEAHLVGSEEITMML